jgi:hypothetical protein
MNSNYVILSGPALATAVQNSAVTQPTKYLSLLNVSASGLPQVGTLVAPASLMSKKLVIGTLKNEGDLGALLSFVQAVLLQYKGHQVIATDADALVLAIALSNEMESTDPAIIEAWTKLTFVVEAQSSNATSSNNIRFVGTNITGIKALSAADSVTFTITAK